MDIEKLENNLVREGLSLAPVSKRLKAFIVDELLISALVLVAFWDSLASASSVTESAQAVNSLFMVIITLKVAYQGIFTFMYGATLGKIWQRIMIVNEDDFYKPNLTISLIRSFTRVFSEWFMYAGFAWAYVSPAKQTWHDKLGKTIVIDV